MGASTKAIDTPQRAGEVINLDMAAAVKVFIGIIVAVNAAGNALAAADTAGLRVVGRCEEDVDNSAGAAADKTVQVKKGVFRWDISEADPVTKAQTGQIVYVEDDHTIRKTGGDNNIAAGILEAVDDDGAWVNTGLAAIAI